MTPDDPPFSEWCILELMGHRRLAGKVTEVELAGVKMLRLDAPSIDGCQPLTQFYGASSVYCLTPTTEEIARRVAALSYPMPVQRFELTEHAPISPTPRPSDDDDDERERFVVDLPF